MSTTESDGTTTLYTYDPNTGGLDAFKVNLSSNFANTSTAYGNNWLFDQRTGLPSSDSINSYRYETSRRLASVLIPGNQTLGSNFDGAGRNTSDQGKWQVSGFDGLSRPKAMINSDDGKTSVNAVNYTALQQVNEAVWGSAGGTMVNDAYYPTTGAVPAGGSRGALQSMTLTAPGEQEPVETNYTYNSVSQRLQTINVNGITITYAYLPNSDQVQSVTAGSVNMVYTPDGSDGARLGEISVQGGTAGNILFDESISSYNAQDQRTGENVSRANVDDTGQGISENDTISYSYDPAQADALTGVTVDGQAVASYSYDAMGNRIGGPVGDQYLLPSAAWNTGNAYNWNIQYDDNHSGNETDDGGTTSYTYDDLNRLASATPDSPQTGSLQAKFGYDNQNRLLWEDVNTYDADSGTWSLSYTRKFVWDGMNMLAMLDGNNTLL